jgi:hypothetical protein
LLSYLCLWASDWLIHLGFPFAIGNVT